MIEQEIMNCLEKRNCPLFYDDLYRKVKKTSPEINSNKFLDALDSLLESNQIQEIGADTYQIN